MRDKIQKAMALHQQGRLADAARIYRQVLRSHPSNVDCLHLLGIIETQQGRHAESVELLDRAIRLSPRQPLFYSNRGIALKQLKRFDAALASLDQAIALQPDFAEAHCNRGNVLQELGQFDAALASYDKAITLKPNYVKAYANRGNVLQELEQFEAALASYDRALALEPGSAEAYCNRASAFQELKQFDAALADFEKAIALNPAYADAHWNSALCHLRLGNFQSGWERYEWRLRKHDFLEVHRLQFNGERWRGHEPLDRKTMLLHGEQGLGDAIQFARYAPLVASLGAHVILSAPRPLVRLFQRLENVDRIVSDATEAGPYDFHCSLLSLPLAFKTTLATIPSATEPYLSADATLVAKWRNRLGAPGRPQVGVMWNGGTASKIRHRSIPLSEFTALLDDPFRFVSLQKDVRESDREALDASPGIAHFGDEQEDFADAAAMIELMDVVISVDTSIAHLAGALGKEAWILLPYSADWRWMEGRSDSPWYPSVRLYRQATRGDWSDVLARVKRDLQRRLHGPSVHE
jgi:hypothetical protein